MVRTLWLWFLTFLGRLYLGYGLSIAGRTPSLVSYFVTIVLWCRCWLVDLCTWCIPYVLISVSSFPYPVVRSFVTGASFKIIAIFWFSLCLEQIMIRSDRLFWDHYRLTYPLLGELFLCCWETLLVFFEYSLLIVVHLGRELVISCDWGLLPRLFLRFAWHFKITQFGNYQFIWLWFELSLVESSGTWWRDNRLMVSFWSRCVSFDILGYREL